MATPRNTGVLGAFRDVARQRGSLGSWVRIIAFLMIPATVGLLVLVGLRAINASSIPENQNPPAVAVVSTSTEVAPIPTSTPTQEPMVTVEEFTALDSDWFHSEVWPTLVEAGRIAGCEVSYEEKDYPEAFLIPLTVDTGSVLHRAVTEMNLCGKDAEPPYLALYVIGYGFPVEWLDYDLNLAGPTSALSLWEGTAGSSLPPHLVGPLMREGSDVLGQVFQCMVPWAADLGLKPVWVVSVSPGIADALNRGVLGRVIGSVDSGTVPYQNCQ